MNERESEVLEKYPFRVERMSRVRGAFLCETEDGLRLLRETDSTEKRLQWENQILLQFPQNHRIRVETYVENVDGAIRHGEQRPPGLLREAMAGGQRV